jgi:hypothetical protein
MKCVYFHKQLNILLLIVISFFIFRCLKTREYLKMNEYNDCYEETAKENPCFHYKEPVYYEKLKKEYPKVPSNSSIYTQKFMRK